MKIPSEASWRIGGPVQRRLTGCGTRLDDPEPLGCDYELMLQPIAESPPGDTRAPCPDSTRACSPCGKPFASR